MKFATREDVETPIEVLFAALTDFAVFERGAMRRGAEVTRVDPSGAPGVGMSWSVRFPVRGKMRRAVCEIAEFEPPGRLLCSVDSTEFSGEIKVTLLALSRTRTRLQIQSEIKPKSLKARLLIQAVRFNRASYERKFVQRIQAFAMQTELRYAREGVR